MGLVVERHPLDVQKAHELVEKMEAVLKGHDKISVEAALVMAYFGGADGVRSFPEETRIARYSLCVSRGMAVLCSVMADVEKLTDEEVRAETEKMVVREPTRKG